MKILIICLFVFLACDHVRSDGITRMCFDAVHSALLDGKAKDGRAVRCYGLAKATQAMSENSVCDESVFVDKLLATPRKKVKMCVRRLMKGYVPCVFFDVKEKAWDLVNRKLVQTFIRLSAKCPKKSGKKED